MLTLRLSVVGTVILALLGGLGGAALAQSEVQYGEDPKQMLYVYEPEPRAEPRPAVVFFHGGGLVMGEPCWYAEPAKWIADQGYVTFNAGYRLFDPDTGDNPWPAQLDDAQRAIRWVRAHADEFNVDPERVCAIGHSSGGHLAGLLGTTESGDDSDPELAGISSRADCVVSLSGDADLMVPYGNAEDTQSLGEVLGGSVDEIPEVWMAASPAHNVDEETVPFLIIHGNQDEVVPIGMSRNLADALAEAGREYVLAEIPAEHFVFDQEATFALQQEFLAYQLHPEE